MVCETAAFSAITPVIGDYLKAIYTFQQTGATVTNALLAEQLNQPKPAAVTATLKKLADLDLIRYTPYHGAQLTEAGERVALELVRHHRLLELFLVEALGYSWDEVHDEADVLEHYISEKLEARIAEHLGNPTVDPHGDPIPSPDGTLPPSRLVSLAEVMPGTLVRVTRVFEQHAEHLRYLASLGLVPGANIEVIAQTPVDHLIRLRVNQTEHYLGPRLASRIFVAES